MSNNAKIITFTSRKGGVGKTACTGLMARYYAEVEGKNVVVIDLDARGGVTSLLTDVNLGGDDLSISEVIQAAGSQSNFQDIFNQAIFDTGLSKNQNWRDNGGRVFLLPSKLNLDTVLANNHFSLLRSVIREIPIPDDMLVLIDTGSSSESVLAGVGAADVVFVPLIMSRQDIPPVFETLRTIILMQREREHNRPAMGGFIINQPGDTQWEEEYIKQYTVTLDEYRKESNLRCASEDLFFFLQASRLIRRGAYLEWTLRKDFYLFAKALADIVRQVRNGY
jgi:MinD-like ATPase involved in chromosome partitioning or flagellar assembly